MPDPHQRRYSPEEVSSIVQRALEGARAEDDTISYSDLVDTARELGIPADRLEKALEEQASRGEIEKAKEKIVRRRKTEFYNHFRSYLIVNGALMLMNILTGGPLWFFWPMIGWGIGLAFHASSTFLVSDESLEAAAIRKVKREQRHRDRKARERGRRAYHS